MNTKEAIDLIRNKGYSIHNGEDGYFYVYQGFRDLGQCSPRKLIKFARAIMVNKAGMGHRADKKAKIGPGGASCPCCQKKGFKKLAVREERREGKKIEKNGGEE